jgi:hypothetical protein
MNQPSEDQTFVDRVLASLRPGNAGEEAVVLENVPELEAALDRLIGDAGFELGVLNLIQLSYELDRESPQAAAAVVALVKREGVLPELERIMGERRLAGALARTEEASSTGAEFTRFSDRAGAPTAPMVSEAAPAGSLKLDAFNITRRA